MQNKTKLLTISLHHPRIVRGGSQQVAYELFHGASKDPEMETHFIGCLDPAIGKAVPPPGAVFTGIDNLPNENLMFSYNFDVTYHLQSNSFVVDKVEEFFANNSFDWVHFHHSLFVGLEMLDIIKKYNANTKIFYTLHEYLPICLADGQLKKTFNKSLCYDYSPSACFRCFPQHSTDFFFLRKSIFMQKFNLVDHFITPSNFSKERFVEWGMNADDITTIPNGQENLRNSNLKPKNTKNSLVVKFGFFGQMVDNKGVHLIIEAAIILASLLEEEFKSNFKFEIYFYGGNLNFASEEYRNKLEELLSSCDDTLKKKLFFKGEYTHEQLPSIFNNIDCVITPSTWFEVFGLVVSEAWMFEKPVIASDIGGLGDRIQNGENGLKFNPNDAYDLAIKMDEYITHYHFGDREFTNIQPPLSQNDFWQAHKTLFSKFS